MTIQAHHQRAIERLTDTYRDDSRYLALIIGGSVAKGYARADSDVDFLIVATDEAFQRHLKERDLFINRRDLCDYEGGYVDGKIIDCTYLEGVAARGNEPSRAAFEGAFATYSHLPDIGDLLRRIPIYQEDGHAKRLRAFYSMAFIQHWLMNEAERHENRYTQLRAASQLALFVGRTILAHNRRLFPYHKWLLRALEAVPDKPPGLMGCMRALIDQPDAQRATALFGLMRDFREWGVSDLDAYRWFMTEVEWSWMGSNTPLEDW
ncbi:MAG: nucleotidyltransferase domain-containing protein [Pseudomonadota bacterium]